MRIGLTAAKVIADSVDCHGQRITTFLLTLPRVILAELNTHRQFSKNSASNRAIPFNKNIEKIENSFYLPQDVRHNEKGMQGFTSLSEDEFNIFANWYENLYYLIKDSTIAINEELNIHKQTLNRVLESFQYIDVVVTSTEWQNFINLRNHVAAHPDIQVLAQEIKRLLEYSKPKICETGNFHLPFISDEEKTKYSLDALIKASVSRCARTSYKTFDGTLLKVEEDVKLYEKLVNAKPIHASPLEHIAICTSLKAERYFSDGEFTQKNYHFNLHGWKSFRFLYEIEYWRI